MSEILKISSLIEKLQKIKEIEGDLPMVTVDYQYGECTITSAEIIEGKNFCFPSIEENHKKYVLIS